MSRPSTSSRTGAVADVDARDASAFTRVFDALCAGMTTESVVRLEASGSIHSKGRVEVLEFDTGIFGCELPIGLGMVEVPIAFPGSDLVDEGFDIGDATIEAL